MSIPRAPLTLITCDAARPLAERVAHCLNISVCAATSGRDEFVLAAWNPLGQQVSSWLSIPVSGSGAWQVTTLNASGQPVFVPSQSGALSNRTLSLPELYLNSYHPRDDMMT